MSYMVSFLVTKVFHHLSFTFCHSLPTVNLMFDSYILGVCVTVGASL